MTSAHENTDEKLRMMVSEPTIAIVVITYRRASFLATNLDHLSRQTLTPDQVIVIDASPDFESQQIADRYPWVTYVRNPGGAGNMTNSRNAALHLLQADVVAFLDDDSYARPDYVEALAAFCRDNPDVSIGCCRACNGVPGEDALGVAAIGTMSDSGQMTGNFAANPLQDIPIDHGLGATMWIRRNLLTSMGGFREYFGGTAAREDTDLFMRARRLDHQPWFVHAAIADHVAAPQEGGERFDLRYMYWGSHNQAILLMADRGVRTASFWRAVGTDLKQQMSYGGAPHRRMGRTVVVLVGWLRGVVQGFRIFRSGPVPAVGGYRRPPVSQGS